MLSIVILLLVVWNFYLGYSRGIILQGFYFVGCLVSLAVAGHYYQDLSQKITLLIPYSSAAEGATVSFFTKVNIFSLDTVYYAGLAYTAIAVIAYFVLRLLGVLVHLAPINYFDGRWTNIASGCLSALVTLIFSSLFVTVLATVPLDSIQKTLSSSHLISWLINDFPILSSHLYKLWVTSLLS